MKNFVKLYKDDFYICTIDNLKVKQKKYDFEDFVLEIACYRKIERGKYPCIECGSSGFIYDPKDPYDAYEGNKYRNRLEYPTCKGTMIGPKAPLFELYKKNY